MHTSTLSETGSLNLSSRLIGSANDQCQVINIKNDQCRVINIKNDQCRVINIKVHYLEVYINSIVPNQGKKGKVTFRIQKNIQNGRAVTTISANNKHQTIRPVQLHTIFSPSQRLGQVLEDQPMAVFVKHQGEPSILLTATLLNSCNCWLGQPILTWHPKKYHASHPILGDSGLLFFLMKQV